MSKKGENICKRKDGRWEGRYKTTLTNLVSEDHSDGLRQEERLPTPAIFCR